jgi:hypothetical protein
VGIVNNTSVAFCFLLLAGCGGRAAHPVAINNDYDDRLTCDHLRAEREVNDSKLADLTKERKNGNNNNVGMAVLDPLFLDLSGAERKEAEALTKRNAVLDGMIANKCTLPAAPAAR